MSKKVIQVGIIEDNRFIRDGWKAVIDFEEDMDVAQVYGNCEDALANKALLDLDIMLMDIGLPGMSGVECTEIVTKKKPTMPIIMATVFDDDEHIFSALRAGAVGYLLKNASPNEIVTAIRSARDGGSPITPNIARKVIGSFQKRRNTDVELNERELEILEELATGLSYSAIGKKIYLSEDGVRHHIRNIYRKLQVNSKAEAIKKGIKSGFITV
jgi:DNA-binding NarL/FixJ family response regulator